MVNYIFKSGASNKQDLALVLLLHSTGGDEHQLMTVAETIAPGHPILSIRGRVEEEGMMRYFKLHQPGSFKRDNFDLDSLDEETDWLADEIDKLTSRHALDNNNIIVIGHSNGANVALNMLLKGKYNFDKVIAFHAMQLEEIAPVIDLWDKQIFLSYSENDPVVSEEDFTDLIESLAKVDAQFEIYENASGHRLTGEEVIAAKSWLRAISYQENLDRAAELKKLEKLENNKRKLPRTSGLKSSQTSNTNENKISKSKKEKKKTSSSSSSSSMTEMETNQHD